MKISLPLLPLPKADASLHKRVLTQLLPLKAGTGRQVLDLRTLPPGQYSYRLVTDGQSGPAKHLIITR